jgi:glycolate oxidase
MIPAAAQAKLEARATGTDILRRSIAVGGAITGELMAEMFSADLIAAIRGLKDLFDPDGFFNPGKLLPTGRGCVGSRSGSPMQW